MNRSSSYWIYETSYFNLFQDLSGIHSSLLSYNFDLEPPQVTKIIMHSTELTEENQKPLSSASPILEDYKAESDEQNSRSHKITLYFPPNCISGFSWIPRNNIHLEFTNSILEAMLGVTLPNEYLSHWLHSTGKHTYYLASMGAVIYLMWILTTTVTVQKIYHFLATWIDL